MGKSPVNGNNGIFHSSQINVPIISLVIQITDFSEGTGLLIT